MLICKLKNLEQEAVHEIANGEKALIKLIYTYDGADVAVLCVACDGGGGPEDDYYDIVLRNGTNLAAVSGYHLAGIEAWKG